MDPPYCAIDLRHLLARQTRIAIISLVMFLDRASLVAMEQICVDAFVFIHWETGLPCPRPMFMAEKILVRRICICLLVRRILDRPSGDTPSSHSAAPETSCGEDSNDSYAFNALNDQDEICEVPETSSGVDSNDSSSFYACVMDGIGEQPETSSGKDSNDSCDAMCEL
jgi:hypothetical protein